METLRHSKLNKIERAVLVESYRRFIMEHKSTYVPAPPDCEKTEELAVILWDMPESCHWCLYQWWTFAFAGVN